MSKSRRLRIANGCFVIVFLLSASVQYNDPDPILWMSVYLAAAAGGVAWSRGQLPPLLLRAFFVLVAIGWCFSWTRVSWDPALLGDWQMRDAGSEELREWGGLTLVLVWAALLARDGSANVPAPEPAPSAQDANE